MAERLKYGFHFFDRIITLYLGIQLSRSQCLLPESRVGLAGAAGEALIRLLPPVRVCLTPLQLCSHPQHFGFCDNIYFGRAGNAGLRSTGVDEPTLGKFLLCSITSAWLGKGKSNISIKVSSDICDPLQDLCLLIAPGSEGQR